MLDASGRPLAGAAPLNPLKIGRIVHACDQDGNCVPLVLTLVHDAVHVNGLAFAAQVLSVREIKHQPNPDVTNRIATPGAKAPTWHWPGECPWHR